MDGAPFDALLNDNHLGTALIEPDAGAGAVHTITRTSFGGGKLRSLGSSSDRRGGSPRLERFASEDAVRVAGRKMTLDAEAVVDGGVSACVLIGAGSMIVASRHPAWLPQ
jgi:hypothetical protein